MATTTESWRDRTEDDSRLAWRDRTDESERLAWRDRESVLLEDAIYSKLIASPSVNDLVEYRIYPNDLPQNAELPAIVYERIDGPRGHSQGRDPGFADVLIAFNIWADTYSEVQNVGEALRLLIQDSSGLWQARPSGAGVNIMSILFDGDTHLYEYETERHHIQADYNIWHLETRT